MPPRSSTPYAHVFKRGNRYWARNVKGSGHDTPYLAACAWAEAQTPPQPPPAHHDPLGRCIFATPLLPRCTDVNSTFSTTGKRLCDRHWAELDAKTQQITERVAKAKKELTCAKYLLQQAEDAEEHNYHFVEDHYLVHVPPPQVVQHAKPVQRFERLLTGKDREYGTPITALEFVTDEWAKLTFDTTRGDVDVYARIHSVDGDAITLAPGYTEEDNTFYLHDKKGAMTHVCLQRVPTADGEGEFLLLAGPLYHRCS